MAAAELSVIVSAKDAASSVFKKIEGSAAGLGKTLGTGLKVGAIAAGAGLIGAGFALKGFVEDAMESQKIMAQTNAVIASTKGAAGMSAAAIGDLAGELSKVIPIDDEVIQSAENMLLTFTGIGKEIFPQVTEAALNMATALGTEPVSAAQALGKALNDPTAGLSKLTKQGVVFTDQQKDLIKSLQASGDVVGAQKVILKELETEYGNSGRAAGETFAGKLKILGTQIGNIKEGIGMMLIPLLSRLADLVIAHVVPAFERGVEILTTFANYIKSAAVDGDALNDFLADLPAPLQGTAKAIGDVVVNIKELLPQMEAIAKSVAIDTFEGWKTILAELAPKLQEFGQFLIDHKPLLIALGVAVAGVLALLVGWPLLIVGVVVAVGYLTTKLQEWRKENEDLDASLKALEVTVRGISMAISSSTAFVEKHTWAQQLLKGFVIRLVQPLIDLIHVFHAIGFAVDFARAAFEKATGPMEWVRDRAYWIRDAFFAMRDAIAETIEKLNIFHDIPGAGLIGKAIGGARGLITRADGGMIPSGGAWTITGERGPELGWLPGGARIFSNAESRRMVAAGDAAGGNVTNVYVYPQQIIIQGDPSAGLAALGAAY